MCVGNVSEVQLTDSGISGLELKVHLLVCATQKGKESPRVEVEIFRVFENGLHRLWIQLLAPSPIDDFSKLWDQILIFFLESPVAPLIKVYFNSSVRACGKSSFNNHHHLHQMLSSHVWYVGSQWFASLDPVKLTRFDPSKKFWVWQLKMFCFSPEEFLGAPEKMIMGTGPYLILGDPQKTGFWGDFLFACRPLRTRLDLRQPTDPQHTGRIIIAMLKS